MQKPTLSTSDFSILKETINNLPSHLKTKEIGAFMQEINRAELIADELITDDIIRINSKFEVLDTKTNKSYTYTLTWPQKANLATGLISVLSPLGIALIGFKEGSTVEWTLPGGLKQLKINKVTQLQ
jgi:regulator of nucleoside diphosphate kinase